MNQPLLDQCLAQATAAAAPLLDRITEQAIESLRQAESASGKSTERRELADAYLELMRVKAGWPARFQQALAQGWQATLQGRAPEATPPAPAKGLTLSLVADEQVSQGLEAARIRQVLLPVVEQALSEFDGLMSSALGLPTVQPERNPLQPDVFARALHGLLREASSPAVAAHWARPLAPALARELDKLYRELTERLRGASLKAAGYRVLPVAGARSAPARTAAAPRADEATRSPSPAPGSGGSPGAVAHGPASRGEAAAGSGPAAPDWADLARADLAHPVLQDFIYHGGPQVQAPLQAAYHARADEEVAELEAAPIRPDETWSPEPARLHLHLPPVDRPMRHVGTDSPLEPAVWGRYGAPRERSLLRARLKQRAERVGQALGLELVRKLVDQVAKDPRLLAPVREAIVALEPSLLRLALVDPRYFGDEANPARRLVEHVAERSFKYNDEAHPDFRVFAEQVAEAFNRLNAQPVDDAAPFASALDALQATWAGEDKAEEARRTQVLDAVRFAEERQAEADRIAWDLSQRPDLDGTPPVVQDFLFGPWALVLAQARLTAPPGQLDPGGYAAVITDLLWSVKREETLRQPARLFEILPGLLDRLRAGLAALGQDGTEAASFFQSLEKLHRPVMRLRAKHRKEARASQPADLEPVAPDPALDPAAARKPEPRPAFWMGRRELQTAGYQDTLPADRAELVELHERAAEQAARARAAEAKWAAQPVAAAHGGDAVQALDETAADTSAEAQLATLREGCWVDLFSRNQWLRAQLIWAAARGTLFMFQSHGGQPHSMTRRICLRLMRERLLRPVESHGVVAHALRATVKEAPRELVAA